MDSRLRDAERRALASGNDEDMLAWARELDRAGAFDDRLEMLPSMQVRLMDALSEQARSGGRNDILLYMKALGSIGYPLGDREPRDAVHSDDLRSAVACALIGRGVDPEAVWNVMLSGSTWDTSIGPMLDQLERDCDVAMEAIRSRVPPRSLTVTVRRDEAANDAYAAIRRDGYWTSVNIDEETPWRRSGNVWRREVWVSDGMGWYDTVLVTVTFARRSANVIGRTAISDSNNESILLDA